MRRVWTIISNELWTLFTSPIAYIFIVAFLGLNCFLFGLAFFTNSEASLRAFFANLPLFLCFFIPAVTMRTWAEERRQWTLELLLTLPMRPWHLVLGKFLAAWAFTAITLAGTVPLAVMVAVLGKPDPGPIIGGYLGSLLVCALYLAIGLFLSAFFRDQIVAFVLTLAAAMALFFAGMPYLANIVNGWTSGFGLGTFLRYACYVVAGVGLVGAAFRFAGVPSRNERILWAVVGLMGATTLIVGGWKGVPVADLNESVPGFALGTVLQQILGVTHHFEGVERGVLDVRNLCYFVTLTVLFLVLNALTIVTFMRHQARGRLAIVGVLLAVAAVVMNLFGAESAWAALGFLVALVNLGVVMAIPAALWPGSARARLWAGAAWLGVTALSLFLILRFEPAASLRFDLTKDKIYSFSRGAKRAIQSLEEDLVVKYYNTPKEKMPPEYQHLGVYVTDMLTEMSRLSRHVKIEIVPVNPQDEAEQTELQSTLQRTGLKAAQLNVVENDAVTMRIIYNGITLSYLDRKDEVIPFIGPGDLGKLEYELLLRVTRLTQEEKAKLAVYTREEQITPEIQRMASQMGIPAEQLLQYMGGGRPDPYRMLRSELERTSYEVVRFKFNAEEPLPRDAKVVLVMDPRDLDARQQWEIQRFLRAGGAVLIAAQAMTCRETNPPWRTQDGALIPAFAAEPANPGVNEMFEDWGIRIGGELLMDGDVQTSWPWLIVARHDSMNSSHPITRKVNQLFVPMASRMWMDENPLREKQLTWAPLVTTSERAWTVRRGSGERITMGDMFPEENTAAPRAPIAVIVEGQFPAPESPAPPPWTDEAAPPEPVPDEIAAAPGRLLIVACSMAFSDDVLEQVGERVDNLPFLLNSLDYLVDPALLEEAGLARVRTKVSHPTIRGTSGSERQLWRAGTTGGVPALLVGAGVVRLLLRRRRRRAYFRSIQLEREGA